MATMKPFGGVFNVDNEDEKFIAKYLEEQPNKSAYLKSLIKQDIERKMRQARKQRSEPRQAYTLPKLTNNPIEPS